MRAAFVLALIASTVVLPLQPTLAVAQPTVSAAVELAVGVAQLDTHDVIVVEANHVDITIGQNVKTLQSAIVVIVPAPSLAVPTVSPVNCATVSIAGTCPSPSGVFLQDCSDSTGPILNTYIVQAGGAGVGTFSDSLGISGTVSHGNITMSCQTVPPPAPIRRR